MRTRRSLFLPCLLRGYAQLFLANRPSTGIFFLAGLIALSPIHAGWSLVSASILTAIAIWRMPQSPLIQSGLFGVNGVLLGYLWILFPDVSPAVGGMLTIAASLAMAFVLIPVSRFLHHRKWPFTLFSLPYVLTAWLMLGMCYSAGLANPHFSAAWHAVSARHIVEARRQFADIKASTPRMAAYRSDGLGWSAFHAGGYTDALAYFEEARAADPTFADACDGSGWANYRLGRVREAETAFRAAVRLNPWLADSWDGRGWLALQSGATDQARSYFIRAALAAPIFGDAYAGLAESFRQMGHLQSARVFRDIAGWLSGHVSGSAQFISSRQIACWLFFLLGLLVYSRLSALIALAALVICRAGAALLPYAHQGLFDLEFSYNLIALWIALGGHYLRWRPFTAMWMIGCFAILAIFQSSFTGFMAASGFPLLCLPFNLLLIGSLVVISVLRKRGWVGDHVVPLELAVAAPETIQCWMQKQDNARQCWKAMDRMQNSVGT